MGRFLYRLRFTKTGDARFYSHHDMMRLLERGLRREEFPISLSEGFSPRPRVTFLSALPLGVESVDEWVEIELTENREPGDFVTRLVGQLPAGMVVTEATRAEGRVAAVEAEYEAEIGGATVDTAALLARKEVPVERRTNDGKSRTVDIRPWILQVATADGKLRFSIRITDNGSARPEEVLRELGVTGARILRTKTVMAAKK
ncbi:MAG: TIGR03936 family radical SAM-associated protein [Planctomycetes bacterium]|nr:TIGR03936 family radical SAM-associated protein [Planctomycetota bacterium]